MADFIYILMYVTRTFVSLDKNSGLLDNRRGTITCMWFLEDYRFSLNRFGSVVVRVLQTVEANLVKNNI